jgi:hypothetical protein
MALAGLRGTGFDLGYTSSSSGSTIYPSSSLSASPSSKQVDYTGLDPRVSSVQPGQLQGNSNRQLMGIQKPSTNIFKNDDIKATIRLETTKPGHTHTHIALNTLNQLIKEYAVKNNIKVDLDKFYEANKNEVDQILFKISDYTRNLNDINRISAINNAISALCTKLPGMSSSADSFLGGRKTFTRKYKNRKYKVSSKSVRKSSHKRNTYRNKRHSRRH